MRFEFLGNLVFIGFTVKTDILPREPTIEEIRQDITETFDIRARFLSSADVCSNWSIANCANEVAFVVVLEDLSVLFAKSSG